MGWWSDELIAVPKVTFRRLAMLAEEVEALNGEEIFPGMGVQEKTGYLATRILDEYVRQHFVESTKQTALLFERQRGRLESWNNRRV